MHVSILFIFILFPATILAENFLVFDVEWRNQRVGSAAIVTYDTEDARCIDYRLSVEVKKFGISLYSMQRHQQAAFSPEGMLLHGRATNIERGNAKEILVTSTPTHVIVESDSSRMSLPRDEIAGSTLTPLLGLELRSGAWVDFNKGIVVPYEISKEGAFITVHRPEGSDQIERDSAGMLSEVRISDNDGAVVLRRSGMREVDVIDAAVPAVLSGNIPACDGAGRSDTARARLSREGAVVKTD